MNNLQSIPVLAVFIFNAFCLSGQTTIVITNADLQGGETYQWTADNTYLLDGLVYLEKGSVLNIEAGTVIRGMETPSDESHVFSALIINKEATINAIGDVCNPIIFTSENDDFEEQQQAGRWGGLVLLGRAPIVTNEGAETNEILALNTVNNQAIYGEDFPGDNSGVLQYVSIRYAGDLRREAFLPGLILAGVGNGTQIDHVEVFASGSVGIGVRGGMVNTKYISSVFNAFASFQYSEGYQGFGQFHFSIDLPQPASQGVLHSGIDPDGVALTRPTIYNATFLGAGIDNASNEQFNTAAISFTERSAGIYANSVIADFAGFGLFIRDVGESDQDSYAQLLADNLQLNSNLWGQVRSINTGNPALADLVLVDPDGDQGIGPVVNHLTANNNNIQASMDGLLMNISRTPGGQLDPRPISLSTPFQTTEPTLADPFFTAAPYRGAFNEDLWLLGWTALDFYDYLPDCDLDLSVNATEFLCFGEETGSIELEITGNVSELVIDWNVDAFDGNAQLTGLAPGTYSVTVTNAECCEQQAEITIATAASELTMDCTNTQNASNPGEANGSITISTAGGSAPSTLVLSKPDGTQENFSFGDGNTLPLPNLLAGDYNALVTDDLGCTVDCDFTIGNDSPCFIIQDADLVAGGNYTWTADNCYIIDGLVFLESTGSLTIEPGTVIQARTNPSNGQSTSALIIAKGANIDAQGTEANPIIFTAETADDVSPNDLTAADKGLWGGLAILGDAPIANPASDTGERFWDVLDEIAGAGQYGGDGTQNVTRTLSYVSIRHAGAAILPNQVFPALTFAAVRESAQLDHLEVFAAADRGFAFYGGLAQLAYASATFCEGPAFSWQDGYNGKGQFWFALSDPGSTNLIADHRGYINGAAQDTVVSAPEIYNATFIGGGGTGNTTAVAMRFSESSAGVYGNSIFTHFNGNALEVEDIAGDGNDSESLMAAEVDFFLRNNLFWGFGAGDEVGVQDGFLSASTGAGDPNAGFLVDHLIKHRNKAADPRLISITNLPNGQLDPRPEECAAFFTRTVFPDSVFFDTAVYYKGAFGKEKSLWLQEWTALDEKGFIQDPLQPVDFQTCLMTLDSGVFFLTEFLSDMISSADIEKEKAKHREYANLIEECNCGENGVARLMLWETKTLTNVTNGRSGVEDSTIIDTSALRAIFQLGLIPVIEQQPRNYCGTVSNTDSGFKDSIAIAILDSGIDLSHDELNSYLWTNYEEFMGDQGEDDDENCLVDDIRSFNFIANNGVVFDLDQHGTHLAGIVTAAYPVDIKPQLMNLKVFEKGGTTSNSRGSVFDLICGIHYAINEEAQVINLSIGYWAPEASIPLYNAIKRALDKNITVIVSTGNDGLNVDKRRIQPGQNLEISEEELIYEDRWPVVYKVIGSTNPDFENLTNLIGVSSSVIGSGNQSFEFPDYSNFGKLTMDLSTDGVFHSTVPSNSFMTFQGTSMATAYLSRWISIAKGYRPDISNSSILNCLKDSSVIQDLPSSSRLGIGVRRFNELAFMECLGVVDSITGYDKSLPKGDLTTRPTFNVQVTDELKVRFGDGSKSFQQIGIVVKDKNGNKVYELYCQGNLIVWNTVLADGTELPPAMYWLETYVNGGLVENPGLRNFIKFN